MMSRRKIWMPAMIIYFFVIIIAGSVFRETDAFAVSELAENSEIEILSELTKGTDYVQNTVCMADSMKEIKLLFVSYLNRPNSGQVSIEVFQDNEQIGVTTLDAETIGDFVYYPVMLDHPVNMGERIVIHISSTSESGQAVALAVHKNSAMARWGAELEINGQIQDGYHLCTIQQFRSMKLSRKFYVSVLSVTAFYIFLGIPRQIYSDWLRFEKRRQFTVYALLFFTGWFFICIRNMHFITYPTIYAEDGLFLSRIIKQGLGNSLFMTRSGEAVEFPNTATYILLWLSYKVTTLLNGYDLGMFPFWNGLVSNMLIAFAAVLGFTAFEQCGCRKVGIMAYCAMIFVILAASSNEVLGRALNTQFLWVIIVAYVLMLLYQRKKAFSVWSCLGFLLCFMGVKTFPICYAQVAGYLFFEFLRAVKKKSILPALAFNAVLILITVEGIVRLPTLMRCSGVADFFTYKPDSAIEFFIARHILFSLVSLGYTCLNDKVTLIVFAIYLGVVGYACVRQYKKTHTFLNVFTLFALLTMGTCFSSAWTRRTMTAFFENYLTTYPDRYYYGCNVLAAVLFVYALYVIFSEKRGTVWIINFSSLALVSMWLLYPMLFYNTRVNCWENAPIKTFSEKCEDALMNGDTETMTYEVELYPRELKMELDTPYVLKTAKGDAFR